MMTRIFFMLFTVLWPSLLSTNTLAQNAVLGDWLAENGRTKIRTYPCKNDTETICSAIIWLKNPRTDGNNKDPKLQERPLIGLEVGKNMRADGEARWIGTAYNPKRGQTFPSIVRLKGDVLEVKGCATSARLVCKKKNFLRVKTDHSALPK